MEKRSEKGKLLVISFNYRLTDNKKIILFNKKLFFSTVDDQKNPKDNDSSIKDFD